ncbi:hypothetical protein Tco_0849104 [Tanacetum coccineum]
MISASTCYFGVTVSTSGAEEVQSIIHIKAEKCKNMKHSQDMQLIQKLRDDQKRMKKVFEVMSGRNIVTNSRVTPSWREIVSLTFSEAGVLHVNWISFGHCVLDYAIYKLEKPLPHSSRCDSKGARFIPFGFHEMLNTHALLVSSSPTVPNGSMKRKRDSECEDESPQEAGIAKRKLGDVDLGWSNKAGAEADCNHDDLLCDLRL